MKIYKLFLLGIIALVQFVLSSVVVAEAMIPAPPELNALSYLVIDHNSGNVIVEHNIDKKLPPASLTKIMTVYVIANELKNEKIHLEDEVTVSEKAWRMPGSRMFIEVDKKVTVENLLKGIIIQSGNDASVAMAEYVSGSEKVFANLMNQHAQKLGMKNTHYMNSTGLPDPQHYTTAGDLAVLANALINNYPEIYAWHSIREFTFNGIKQHNRNKLLWREHTVDGIKTGHTEEAGYCLVASAFRENMRLISVVMGTDGPNVRARASQSLLNYGFHFYETHKLYESGESVNTARVWKGEAENIDLGIEQELYITIPRGQYKHLQASVDIDQKIIAPIHAGDKIGMLNIELNGDKILSKPLIALNSVPKGNIFLQLKDEVRLLFE